MLVELRQDVIAFVVDNFPFAGGVFAGVLEAELGGLFADGILLEIPRPLARIAEQQPREGERDEMCCERDVGHGKSFSLPKARQPRYRVIVP